MGIIPYLRSGVKFRILSSIQGNDKKLTLRSVYAIIMEAIYSRNAFYSLNIITRKLIEEEVNASKANYL